MNTWEPLPVEWGARDILGKLPLTLWYTDHNKVYSCNIYPHCRHGGVFHYMQDFEARIVAMREV